jgi:CheY-like chemotaxis protein
MVHQWLLATTHRGAAMLEDSCVLVVDDDSVLRALVTHVLHRVGCTVVNANDGAQALEILERGGVDIDLVVTDIHMPGLNGLELGRRIARVTPSMPVLYMSAELPDALVDRGANLMLTPFLLKPFSTESLVAAVLGLLVSSSVYRRAADKSELVGRSG